MTKTAPKGSPDMILSAFDLKFADKKDEIPPRDRRPQNKFKQNQKITKIKQEMGAPPARPSGRVRRVQPRGKKKKESMSTDTLIRSPPLPHPPPHLAHLTILPPRYK